jgi:hypothetical protein
MARDILWGFAICAALVYFLQVRPVQSATELIDRDAELAFREVYAGRRFVNGDLIEPPSGKPRLADNGSMPVRYRRLTVISDRPSWHGRRAELIVTHNISFGGGIVGEPSNHEVRISLVQADGTWQYTQFQPRGETAYDLTTIDQPWLKLLRGPTEDSE